MWRLLGSNGRRGLLAGRSALLDGWLAIALFQGRQADGKHKLLFAVVVELNNDVLFRTGHYRAQAVLAVLDLRTLCESWFDSHKRGVWGPLS